MNCSFQVSCLSGFLEFIGRNFEIDFYFFLLLGVEIILFFVDGEILPFAWELIKWYFESS